jgi:hypothetical protein
MSEIADETGVHFLEALARFVPAPAVTLSKKNNQQTGRPFVERIVFPTAENILWDKCASGEVRARGRIGSVTADITTLHPRIFGYYQPAFEGLSDIESNDGPKIYDVRYGMFGELETDLIDICPSAKELVAEFAEKARILKRGATNISQAARAVKKLATKKYGRSPQEATIRKAIMAYRE